MDFNKTVFCLLAVAVPVLLPAPLVQADKINSSQTELKDIQKQIKSLKQKIDSDEKALGKERGEFRKIEQEIVTINEQAAQTRSQIDQVRMRQQELQAEADQERTRVEQELSRLGDLVLSRHAMGDNSYMKLLLGQQDPAALERTMVYYKYLAQLTSAQVNQGREQVEALVALEGKVTEQQASLNQLLDTQRSQQQQLQQASEKRYQAIASLDSQLTKSANKVGRLKEDENRIRKLVAGLQEAARQREKARAEAAAKVLKEQQQAASKAAKQTPTVTAKKSTTTTVIKPVIQRISNDGLGKYKGRLEMPVTGTIRAGYGTTKPGSGIRWNGIMLAVADGAPVRSIYDGQVVYADWFRGFGELVIVDHGKGYMSLYSHNSRLTRAPGELVKANEIIAYTGSSGGLAQPGLYFEVRYNGEPRDPLLWVKR